MPRWIASQIVEVLWVATAPFTFEHLVVQRGWDLNAFEAWATVRRFGVLATALTGCSMTGCVQTPTDGTALPSPYAIVAFEGDAVTPNAAVTVLALNLATSAYETIATTASSSTPEFAANTAGNNPALYGWTVSTAIASPDDPDTLFHWNVNDELNPCDTASLKVNIERSTDVFTFGPNGVSCIESALFAGSDAVKAARNCAVSSGGVISFSHNGDGSICIP